MGIAQELEKLGALRRNGTLSEADFEKAKAALLQAAPPPGPAPAAAPSTSSAVQKPKRTGFFLAGTYAQVGWKVLIGVLAVIGACFVLCVAVVTFFYPDGKRDGEKVRRTRVGGVQVTEVGEAKPAVIRDEVQSLRADSWKGLALNLPYSGALTVTVQVARGNPLDVFLLDREGFRKFERNEACEHVPNFAAVKTAVYKRSGVMRQGVYWLVLRDTTLGVLSCPTTDVKVVVRLDP